MGFSHVNVCDCNFGTFTLCSVLYFLFTHFAVDEPFDYFVFFLSLFSVLNNEIIKVLVRISWYTRVSRVADSWGMQMFHFINLNIQLFSKEVSYI